METVIHPLRKLRAALGESTHQTDGNGVTRSDSKSGGTNAIGELYGRKWKTKWWSANLYLYLYLYLNLNKVILREQYYPPSQQEIMSRLAGAKYFSNLDAKSGFWHMLLNTESSYLTWTFKIPFGRFLFLVVPFGVVFPKRYSTEQSSKRLTTPMAARLT